MAAPDFTKPNNPAHRRYVKSYAIKTAGGFYEVEFRGHDLVSRTEKGLAHLVFLIEKEAQENMREEFAQKMGGK
jgi:hypothetical protein